VLKAVFYTRVSTDAQDASNQFASVTALAERHGFKLGEIYCENETAWKAGHQAELARLLKDARKRKFDVVIAWAYDRMCRLGSKETTLLINSLTQCGVGFISHEEEWLDTTGPFKDVLISFIGLMAKMESDRKSANTKLGLKRTLEKGITKAGNKITALGRPKGSKDTEKRVRRWHRRPVL